MKKITIVILMISIIVTLFGGCNPSLSGTEVNVSPAVSTPDNSPVITPSIAPSKAPPSPSLTPKSSPEPTQSDEIEQEYIYGNGERLWAEDITLEQAMRFIIFADYLYPSEYLESDPDKKYPNGDYMGAINDVVVYELGVLDDAYEEKGFGIFKSYYRDFYTEKALEKAMLLKGIININGVICDYDDPEAFMGGHADFTSEGTMVVDEPAKKVVKVQRFEYWGDGTLAYDNVYIDYTLTRGESLGGYYWIISDIDLTPIYGDKIVKKIFTEKEKKGINTSS